MTCQQIPFVKWKLEETYNRVGEGKLSHLFQMYLVPSRSLQWCFLLILLLFFFGSARPNLKMCMLTLTVVPLHFRGGWCVVRVFHLFVVLCENSLWHGVRGMTRSLTQESWNQRNAWGCEKRPPVSWLQAVSTQALEKVIWKKWGVGRTGIFTLQQRISIVSFQV